MSQVETVETGKVVPENSEGIENSGKDQVEKRRDYSREYYQRNKEKKRKYEREYYRQHKDELLARKKESRESGPKRKPGRPRKYPRLETNVIDLDSNSNEAEGSRSDNTDTEKDDLKSSKELEKSKTEDLKSLEDRDKVTSKSQGNEKVKEKRDVETQTVNPDIWNLIEVLAKDLSEIKNGIKLILTPKPGFKKIIEDLRTDVQDIKKEVGQIRQSVEDIKKDADNVRTSVLQLNSQRNNQQRTLPQLNVEIVKLLNEFLINIGGKYMQNLELDKQKYMQNLELEKQKLKQKEEKIDQIFNDISKLKFH